MNTYLRKVGHVLHSWHEHGYTFWKLRETQLPINGKMNYEERQYLFCYQSALRGENLIAYDIGAANGTVSSCLAKLSNIKEVHAFEPIVSAFDELKIRVKESPKVICHNVALGDFNSEYQMWVIEQSRDSSSILRMGQIHKDEVPGINFSDHSEKIQVVRLDDYAIEKKLPLPNVIKIDVQGYEGHVLQGGQKTIPKARFCIVEMSFVPLYENAPLFDDIYSILQTMGFRLIGVCEHIPGNTGIQMQVDGIFQKEGIID
ncbi:MAG: FkbM family methyltransferase [Bacteroidetes bacterium]|nr:FkbM family methyltransferase [Bacteroidota bacterium]